MTVADSVLGGYNGLVSFQGKRGLVVLQMTKQHPIVVKWNMQLKTKLNLCAHDNMLKIESMQQED